MGRLATRAASDANGLAFEAKALPFDVTTVLFFVTAPSFLDTAPSFSFTAPSFLGTALLCMDTAPRFMARRLAFDARRFTFEPGRFALDACRFACLATALLCFATAPFFPAGRVSRYARAVEYTIQQVVERTGLAPRVIREWTSRDVVAKPTGRGPGTRYSEDLVLRLMAVQRLRLQGMPLRTIRSELRRMSKAQVAAFLGETLEAPAPASPPPPTAAAPPPEAADPALGFDAPPAALPAAPTSEAVARAPETAALPPGQPFVIAWLLPQLGIIVGQNAPPLVRRIAAEIFERYAVTAPAPTAPPE